MNNNSVNFLGRPVGPGHPAFIIGEVGLNHDGDLEVAKALITAAKVAGCAAVKFQKRDVANLAIKSVLDAKDERFPAFGKTYREVREHIEFDAEQFRALQGHAAQVGIPFLCTPFDIPSVEFLEKLGVEGYKVASHSVTNLPLLESIAGLGKPTIMSTGMATLDEVDGAVEVFRKGETPLILLHCVSAYPTPPEECNLRLIPRYRERYGVPVGYSGHELGWVPTLAAVALGANAVERHITLDNRRLGFDHKLSLMPDELVRMVREIRDVEAALGNGEKAVSATEQFTANKYHVSWVSARAIKPGTHITEDMLALKNPGTGIPSYKKGLVLGRRARVAIPPDTLLTLDMLEQ